MGYYLFLDDYRKPSDVTWVHGPICNHWEVVRNYNEFVDYISQHGIPEYVSFDHDLADEHYQVMLEENQHVETFTAFIDDDQGGLNATFHYGPEKTGYDCAKWLVDYCVENGQQFPYFRVHSMNPVGKQRIISYIANAKRHLAL